MEHLASTLKKAKTCLPAAAHSGLHQLTATLLSLLRAAAAVPVQTAVLHALSAFAPLVRNVSHSHNNHGGAVCAAGARHAGACVQQDALARQTTCVDVHSPDRDGGGDHQGGQCKSRDQVQSAVKAAGQAVSLHMEARHCGSPYSWSSAAHQEMLVHACAVLSAKSPTVSSAAQQLLEQLSHMGPCQSSFHAGSLYRGMLSSAVLSCSAHCATALSVTMQKHASQSEQQLALSFAGAMLRAFGRCICALAATPQGCAWLASWRAAEVLARLLAICAQGQNQGHDVRLRQDGDRFCEEGEQSSLAGCRIDSNELAKVLAAVQDAAHVIATYAAPCDVHEAAKCLVQGLQDLCTHEAVPLAGLQALVALSGRRATSWLATLAVTVSQQQHSSKHACRGAPLLLIALQRILQELSEQCSCRPAPGLHADGNPQEVFYAPSLLARLCTCALQHADTVSAHGSTAELAMQLLQHTSTIMRWSFDAAERCLGCGESQDRAAGSALLDQDNDSFAQIDVISALQLAQAFSPVAIHRQSQLNAHSCMAAMRSFQLACVQCVRAHATTDIAKTCSMRCTVMQHAAANVTSCLNAAAECPHGPSNAALHKQNGVHSMQSTAVDVMWELMQSVAQPEVLARALTALKPALQACVRCLHAMCIGAHADAGSVHPFTPPPMATLPVDVSSDDSRLTGQHKQQCHQSDCAAGAGSAVQLSSTQQCCIEGQGSELTSKLQDTAQRLAVCLTSVQQMACQVAAREVQLPAAQPSNKPASIAGNEDGIESDLYAGNIDGPCCIVSTTCIQANLSSVTCAVHKAICKVDEVAMGDIAESGRRMVCAAEQTGVLGVTALAGEQLLHEASPLVCRCLQAMGLQCSRCAAMQSSG